MSNLQFKSKNKFKKAFQLITILIILSSLTACETNEAPSKKTPVITQKVNLGQFTDTNIFTGTLEAKNESIISAEANGVLLDLPIEVGSFITPDTTLATINTDSTNVQIQALANQLKALNNQAQTINNLYGQQIQNGQQNLNNTILATRQSQQSIQTQLHDTKTITLPDTRTLGDSSFNIVKTQMDIAQDSLHDLNEHNNNLEENIEPLDDTEIQNKLTQLDRQLTSSRAQGYSKEDSTIIQVHNLENQLQQAQIESKSKIDQQYQSLATLQKQKSSSLAEINTQSTQIQGQLQSLALSKSKGKLTTNLNGVVIEKYTETGQMVQAGTPIVKIADISQFKITFDVPNSFLPELSQTRELSLQFDSIPNKFFVADISKMLPQANPNSKKVTLEAFLRSNDDPRLLPGLYGTIHLNSKTSQGLTIPSSALISKYGQTYVFIKEGDKASKRKVKIIKRNEDTILISGNIQPQNEIITKGHKWLRDGDKISVVYPAIASNK